GDHKHIGEDEEAIAFSDVDELIEAFYEEVDRWLSEN
ncbi:MAG: hypothetical protein JWN07_1495, partial [Hyphomicrobiales bacterium]|nr:hypothetical protein [Hyphomicrobiales bacterium]